MTYAIVVSNSSSGKALLNQVAPSGRSSSSYPKISLNRVLTYFTAPCCSRSIMPTGALSEMIWNRIFSDRRAVSDSFLLSNISSAYDDETPIAGD